MCLLAVLARFGHRKLAQSDKNAQSCNFSKHVLIRDSQYPFESGAVGAFSCLTNTSLWKIIITSLDNQPYFKVDVWY